MSLLLGTRASPLARWQAQWVADRLRESGVDVELVLLSTQGDQDQGPIGAIGTSGLFTKEIQRAVLQQRADLAVHSLKDLPTEAVAGLCLAAVPPRADPWDVLVSRGGLGQRLGLEQLARGARIGTGSLRRRAQLQRVRPDLQFVPVRGNLDTRLRKLDEGQFEALVLAAAGLRRLGLEARISEILPPSILLPAVGQAALGLETRCEDRTTRAAVERLNDADSYAAVIAERALLAALHGGCLAPIAAWGRREGDQLVLTARVLSVDGAQMLEHSAGGPPQAAEGLGQGVAQVLLDQGAAALVESARQAR